MNKKEENVILVVDCFTASEAREILMNAFLSQIQFHELKNFSSMERFGKPDKTAEKRIPKLKKILDEISKLFANATKNRKHVNITSEISISLFENK